MCNSTSGAESNPLWPPYQKKKKNTIYKKKEKRRKGGKKAISISPIFAFKNRFWPEVGEHFTHIHTHTHMKSTILSPLNLSTLVINVSTTSGQPWVWLICYSDSLKSGKYAYWFVARDTDENGKMPQRVKVLSSKPDGQAWFPRSAWQKERTNSSMLSFDLHKHAMTHENKQTNLNKAQR